jgi:hypothetical protein
VKCDSLLWSQQSEHTASSVGRPANSAFHSAQASIQRAEEEDLSYAANDFFAALRYLRYGPTRDDCVRSGPYHGAHFHLTCSQYSLDRAIVE